MKLSELFKRGKNQENTADDAQEQHPEEVTANTKIKVVAALLVAGFATYVAWWVQEPADIRADVLAVTEESASSETMEMAMTDEMHDSAEEKAVDIQDFAFSPAEISVEAGETVTWVNKDSVPHTVTGENFSSGTLNSGESYSYTFNDEGTFEYKCSFHPQMTASVTVGVAALLEDAGSPAEEGMATELLTPAVTETALEFETTSDFEEEPVYTPLTQESAAAANGTVISFGDLSDDMIEVTLETDALLAEGAHLSAEQKTLAKSGPEDALYVGLFAAILWFNRRKLASALR